MITQEDWMNLRALKPLIDAGYSYAAIAAEAGCDWRTAKKYLESELVAPGYGPRPPRGKLIDPFTGVIDEWLRAEIKIKAKTIHERLVADPYHFPGSYQRVKEYVRTRRPEIEAELGIKGEVTMHRRFETIAGAQAQVDWGDEGTLQTAHGDVPVYTFHMVLSYSRDPFCCYVTSQDLATFWDCHRRAFDHFGGVPVTILYDRTKTVVKNHVGKGRDGEVELHPEALAFAAHYDFAIQLCWPYRPETKGKVERVVGFTREKVLAGRTFTSTTEMNGAWQTWLPTRRAQVHRTHGEVIAVRAERDRVALRPLPERPYVVSDRHLRVVGKDALVSFEASLYSVPWTQVRPGQRVELRITRDSVAVYSLGPEPQLLATHGRATTRGSWVVDHAHWDGLPDGTRAHEGPGNTTRSNRAREDLPTLPGARTVVARRQLSAYDALFTKEDMTS